MDTKKLAIFMEQVTFQYKDVEVLKDFHLSITEGEKVLFKGDSGCGKSTLLNIIYLLLRIQKGKYILFNKDISTCDYKTLDKIRSDTFGYLSQSFSLVEQITPRENIFLFSNMRGFSVNEKKVLELCDFLNIRHLYKKKISLLSGGERQRVSILLLFSNTYKVYLLDEPSLNLDENNINLLSKLIQQTDATFLISSHDFKMQENTERVVLL